MDTQIKHIDFGDYSVDLKMEIAFAKDVGFYIKCWGVFENSSLFDVNLMPADDLLVVAKHIQQTLDNYKESKSMLWLANYLAV